METLAFVVFVRFVELAFDIELNRLELKLFFLDKLVSISTRLLMLLLLLFCCCCCWCLFSMLFCFCVSELENMGGGWLVNDDLLILDIDVFGVC